MSDNELSNAKVDYEKRYQELKETHQLDYTPPPSLLHFLEKGIWTHTGFDPSEELSVLEIGCGSGSLFDQIHPRLNVTSIDLSPTALDFARENTKGSNIVFFQGEWGGDFPYFPENSFDLVLDAHCLHCLIDKTKREKALSQVRRVLKPGGWFALEHMVSHGRMEFEPPYQYVENILYYAGVPQRLIPHSMVVEEEILKAGFEICYLRVFETLKIIPVSGRSEPLGSDPDIMRLLCKMKGA